MSNKFTPGPWKVEMYEHGETGIVDLFLSDANRRRFATKIVMEPSEKEQCAKTYALLAAAPEMYKKLKALSNVLRKTVPLLADDIDSLLKEARGEK